jgi:hypothetical protein
MEQLWLIAKKKDKLCYGLLAAVIAVIVKVLSS